MEGKRYKLKHINVLISNSKFWLALHIVVFACLAMAFVSLTSCTGVGSEDALGLDAAQSPAEAIDTTKVDTLSAEAISGVGRHAPAIDAGQDNEEGVDGADLDIDTESDDIDDDAERSDEADDDETDPESARRAAFSPVLRTMPVEDSHFTDSVFLGDSRVMGLMLYSGLTDSTFYAHKGISVSKLLTEPFVMQTNGVKISAEEALKKRYFSNIYIKAGLNELGWKNITLFTDAYGEVIDRLRELQPGAEIYVQSILPVTAKKSSSDPVFNNTRIMEFNEALKNMAWEKDVHYLDVYSGMINDEGYLPAEAASDGVHLKKEYCLVWLDYLRHHTATPGSIAGEDNDI